MGIHRRKRNEFVRRELDSVFPDAASLSELGCHGNRSRRNRTRMGKTIDERGSRKHVVDSNKIKSDEYIVYQKYLEKKQPDSETLKSADTVEYLLKELKDNDPKHQKNIGVLEEGKIETGKTHWSHRETLDKFQLKQEGKYDVNEMGIKMEKEIQDNKETKGETLHLIGLEKNVKESTTEKLRRIEAQKARVKEVEMKRDRKVLAEIQAKISENDLNCRKPKLVVNMDQSDSMTKKFGSYLDVNDNRLVNDSDDEEETSPKMRQDPMKCDSVNMKKCQDVVPGSRNVKQEADPFKSCSLNTTDKVAGELDHDGGQYSSEPVEHSWPSSQMDDVSTLDMYKSSCPEGSPGQSKLATPQTVYCITGGYPDPKIEEILCYGDPLVQMVQSAIQRNTKSLPHEKEKEEFPTDDNEDKYKPEESIDKECDTTEAGDDAEEEDSEVDVDTEDKIKPEERNGTYNGKEGNNDELDEGMEVDDNADDKNKAEEIEGMEEDNEKFKSQIEADGDADDKEENDVDDDQIIDAEEKDVDTEKDIFVHNNDDTCTDVDDEKCFNLDVKNGRKPFAESKIEFQSMMDYTSHDVKLKVGDSKEIVSNPTQKTVRHRLKKRRVQDTETRSVKELQGRDDSDFQAKEDKVREKHLKKVPRPKANKPTKSSGNTKDRKGPSLNQESRMDIYIPEKLRDRRHVSRGRKCGRQCSGQGKAGDGGGGIGSGGGGGINSGGNGINSGGGSRQQQRGGNSNRREEDKGDDAGSGEGWDKNTLRWNFGAPTQDMADVSIPPDDFKGPRKKHSEMKDWEWAQWLGQLSSKIKDDGLVCSVENAQVSACISKCLMKPECITVDMISCNVCNTVHSMLKHYADCVSLYMECSLCMQIFSLICSHIYDCMNNNACDGRLCASVMLHLSGESIVLHLRQMWFRVRKKLARIIGGSDIMVEPVPEAVRSRHSRPSSSIISMQPSLASIPEAAVAPSVASSRSSSRVLVRKPSSLAGVTEQTEQQKAETATGSHSNEPASVVYMRETEAPMPHPEQSPASLTSDPPSSGPFEGSKFPSMPIGPPNKGEVYYPSFTDRPTKKKGIGEVQCGSKKLLVSVAGTWSHYKLQYQMDGQLDRHYREEGIILTEFKHKLQIEGLRYAQNFQWLKVSPLGNGMSGKCHLARDFNTEFQFCVKEIHISNYEKEEIELWSELDHPYIVQIYGAIRHGEKVYIFQEFIQGGCLTEAINEQKQLNRRLSQRTALRIFQQLLHVLVYLKSKHILHEDIKADNILLHKQEGRVAIKLADFGLARRCASTVRKQTKPIGTQTQWSPQKAEGTGYGPCAEVWAAVCVLVHILSGLPPWIRRFENSKTLIFVIVENSPPIEDIPKNILPEIKDLIERGFTLGREKRPTAEQLLIHRAFHILDEASGLASNAFSILEPTLLPESNKIDQRDMEILEIYQTLNAGTKSIKPPASISAYPVIRQPTDQNDGAAGNSANPTQRVSAPDPAPMQAGRNVDPSSHFHNFISDIEPLVWLPNIRPVGGSLTLYNPGDAILGSNNSATAENENLLDIENAIYQGLPNFIELDIPEFLPEELNSEDDKEDEKKNFFEDFDLVKAIAELELNSDNSKNLPKVIESMGSNNNSFQTSDKFSEEEKGIDSINIENEDDLFRSDPGHPPVVLTQHSNQDLFIQQPLVNQGLPNPGFARKELQSDQHYLHDSNSQIRLGLDPTSLRRETQPHGHGFLGSQSLEPHQNQVTRPTMDNQHYSHLPGAASFAQGNRFSDPSGRPGRNFKASTDTTHWPYSLSTYRHPNLSASHNQPLNMLPSHQHQNIVQDPVSAERISGQLKSPGLVESKRRRKEPVFQSPLSPGQGLVPSTSPQSAESHPPQRQQVKEGMNALNERRRNQMQTSSGDSLIHQRNEGIRHIPLHIDVTKAQLAPTAVAPDMSQTAPVTHTVNTHLAPQRSQSEIAPQSGHRGNRLGLASPLSESSSKSRSQYDVQEEAFRELQDDVLSQHSEHMFDVFDTPDQLDAEDNLDDEHFMENARQSLAYMLNEQDNQFIKVEIISDANGKKLVMNFPLHYKNHTWQDLIQAEFSNCMFHRHFGITRFTFRCEADKLVNLTDVLGESAITLRATHAETTDIWYVEGGMFMH